MRIWSLFIYVEMVIILIFVNSVRCDGERDYLKEAISIKTDAEFQEFLNSLTKEDLIIFGKQVAGRIMDNQISEGDFILMHMIINQYVFKYPEVCFYPSQFMKMVSDKEENFSWRFTLISWLGEISTDKNLTNLFYYFPNLNEVFKILNDIIADDKDAPKIRAKVISISCRSIALSFYTKEQKKEWFKKKEDFINKQVKQVITSLLEILKNPRENDEILINTINGLRDLYKYVELSTQNKIEQAIREALNKNKMYSPNVRISIFSWIIEVLKDSTIEQDLLDLSNEYPEYKDTVKSLIRDIKKMRDN